jgi:hypothetical protein
MARGAVEEELGGGGALLAMVLGFCSGERERTKGAGEVSK